jgi:hypothetical protein
LSADIPRVLSLEPQSLIDVANTFLVVAKACGEQARGTELHQQFLEDLKAISDAVSGPAGAGATASRAPTVFILEWLDPPFDAGHWVPEVLSVCTLLSHSTMCSINSSWNHLDVLRHPVLWIPQCATMSASCYVRKHCNSAMMQTQDQNHKTAAKNVGSEAAESGFSSLCTTTFLFFWVSGLGFPSLLS